MRVKLRVCLGLFLFCLLQRFGQNYWDQAQKKLFSNLKTNAVSMEVRLFGNMLPLCRTITLNTQPGYTTPTK
jgi:hypothetical protein